MWFSKCKVEPLLVLLDSPSGMSDHTYNNMHIHIQLHHASFTEQLKQMEDVVKGCHRTSRLEVAFSLSFTLSIHPSIYFGRAYSSSHYILALNIDDV